MVEQKAMLAFGALAYISALWSQDPLLTSRKATLLFLAFAFAWFFATYYSPTDQRRLILAAGVIVALASVAMVILLPEYGIASLGEWKGVFGQKNSMGLSIFFLFSGLPFCPIASRRQLLAVAGQAILPIGLILLAQSRTSLILAIVLTAVRVLGPLLARSRRDKFPFILYVSFVGISLTALVVTIGRDIILPLLGRNETLTGRTDHWAILSTFAIQHLWLGYGYSAFWTGTGDSLRVFTKVGAVMNGADSGYLETILQFGLVGVGLLLIVLLVAARDFVRLFRRASVPLIAYWYAGLILVTVVGSFTEDLFLNSTGITTFVFVVACAGLRNLQ
jgi:O-antigen ligase